MQNCGDGKKRPRGDAGIWARKKREWGREGRESVRGDSGAGMSVIRSERKRAGDKKVGAPFRAPTSKSGYVTFLSVCIDSPDLENYRTCTVRATGDHCTFSFHPAFQDESCPAALYSSPAKNGFSPGSGPKRPTAAAQGRAPFERPLPGRRGPSASPFGGSPPGHSIPRGRYGPEYR